MANEQRDHEHFILGATFMKYRKVVAEWMVDVCEYFTLHATTTHAALAYLDRLQPNEKFSRFEWQMLAICCILIASKYNECEDHVPDLTTLEEITQQAISNETVLNYELWALKRMGWKLNGESPILACSVYLSVCLSVRDSILTPLPPSLSSSHLPAARTPMAFLSSYHVLGLLLPSDWCPSGSLEVSEERLKAECQSLATQCAIDVRFKSHKATDVAVAIAYCARRKLGVVPVWRPELTAMTGTDPQLEPVAPVVVMIEKMNALKAQMAAANAAAAASAAAAAAVAAAAPAAAAAAAGAVPASAGAGVLPAAPAGASAGGEGGAGGFASPPAAASAPVAVPVAAATVAAAAAAKADAGKQEASPTSVVAAGSGDDDKAEQQGGGAAGTETVFRDSNGQPAVV